MPSFRIKGNLVDAENDKIYPAEITIKNGKISDIHDLRSISEDGQLLNLQPPASNFILPGFVDSHVHIESSMLVPSEIAWLAVVHGTVGTVSDPHEIANVCGMKGVEYMIENGNTVPFKFNFGAPSCVPATTFETAGAILTEDDVSELL